MEKKIVILCELGVGGEKGRVIGGGGIMPTITATCYKDPLKVVKKREEDNSVRWYR